MIALVRVDHVTSLLDAECVHLALLLAQWSNSQANRFTENICLVFIKIVTLLLYNSSSGVKYKIVPNQVCPVFLVIFHNCNTTIGSKISVSFFDSVIVSAKVFL